MVNVIQADRTGAGRRFAVAVARFNELVSGKLLEAALETLARNGARDDDVTVVWVPGSFELPITCRWLAESGEYDAVIALGSVIRGATHHYEHICTQAARGLLDVALATSVPVIFGVLTCDTLDLALERTGRSGNKGTEAAEAALEMAGVRSTLSSRNE